MTAIIENAHEIDDIALCFGELHLVHAFLGIPVH